MTRAASANKAKDSLFLLAALCDCEDVSLAYSYRREFKIAPDDIVFRGQSFRSAESSGDDRFVSNGGSNVSLPKLEASSGKVCILRLRGLCLLGRRQHLRPEDAYNMGSETFEPPFDTTRSTPEDSGLLYNLWFLLLEMDGEWLGYSSAWPDLVRLGRALVDGSRPPLCLECILLCTFTLLVVLILIVVTSGKMVQ
ncbi:hypothetical protein AAG570_000538 [Ranatra chinensis]|uniref:Uncharacterized protein n=1 Tax=Ranatra chinensis TaxID=642074 RepID=A0ABD0ZE91_9HEMI